MKKVIWKYSLFLIPHQAITIPKGAEIISLQIQDGIPCIWVLVSPEAEIEIKHFRMLGTGNYLDDHFTSPYKFIGTFQDSPYVFHVFETKD